MVSTSPGLGMGWYGSDWGNLSSPLNLPVDMHAHVLHACLLLSVWSVHYLINVFVKFFVIGHDCAHKSFSRNKLVEDIVGTLAFLPLIYPYEPWRFKHDRHHAKTNMYVHTSLYNHLQYSPNDIIDVHFNDLVLLT
jgi:fatty acid desaturase